MNLLPIAQTGKKPFKEMKAQSIRGVGPVSTSWFQMAVVKSSGIKSYMDLKGKRVWVPEGDSISYASMEALSLAPVTLPLTDVLTGLQTGLIDIVAMSPIGALVLQWHTKIKYVTEIPLVYTVGFMAIDKRAFGKLSEADVDAALREVRLALSNLRRDPSRAGHHRHYVASGSAPGVLDRLGPRAPVRPPVAWKLVESHSVQAVQDDVVGTVGLALVRDDATCASDLVDRRVRLIVVLPARREQSHRHRSAAAVEAVLDHLAVAGLEHVQWQDLTGEEEHAGQREHRDFERRGVVGWVIAPHRGGVRGRHWSVGLAGTARDGGDHRRHGHRSA